MNKHLKLLGLKGKDLVTGYEGVITSVSFDLYGCVQVVVTPPIKDGKKEAGDWFDVNRIKILDNKPVMITPDFDNSYIADGRKGGYDKPLP